MTEQERYSTTTPFQVIYDRCFSKITDDMYIEWTKEETYADAKNMLLAAIPKFEHPKFKLFDYDSEAEVTTNGVTSQGRFNFGLEPDEVEIFAELMHLVWVERQISTIDITRMKYSSSDFKVTSQANHLDKLLKMKEDFENANRHLQKVYGRRRVDENGYIRPNFGGLAGGSDLSGGSKRGY